MKYIIYLLAIIFLAGVNVGVFSYFKILGVGPNLFLLFVFFAATEKYSDDYLFLAFISGVFLDFFTGAFFGTFTLPILFSSFLLRIIMSNWVLLFEVNWKNLIILMTAFFTSVYIFAWLVSLATFKFGWNFQQIGFGVFTWKFVVVIIYNLLLLYPVYLFVLLLKKINRNFVPQNRNF
ncbi:MAG: hypothetical protein COT92_00025 [Candidatus Doudnabacteria bacterium CG10_big_fil_rev_8_21_14_0_10_42_18]|uniref:Rod shape-determining protein MreD n=1 Tax=Candidatus Doudnabacteria bacterium CG10_big_fil_rev_8_21_14_0_10_42_18 TaxID=1974552 RepID=A0A2H0VBZ1_9BACT|nr:MAG: hypothetical protein COT92_00025 [Candidatus Doudnabacteria bacterium CG10_big_fil_rev_8_21_14_0_10_42_18]